MCQIACLTLFFFFILPFAWHGTRAISCPYPSASPRADKDLSRNAEQPTKQTTQNHTNHRDTTHKRRLYMWKYFVATKIRVATDDLMVEVVHERAAVDRKEEAQGVKWKVVSALDVSDRKTRPATAEWYPE